MADNDENVDGIVGASAGTDGAIDRLYVIETRT